MTERLSAFQIQDAIAALIEPVHSRVQLTTVGYVEHKNQIYPLPLVCMGSADPAAPAVAYVGGVHGLERIGTEVVLAFLRSLVGRMLWDKSLNLLLEQVHVVFMPMVNPVGLQQRRRSNGNGVDLMRNAPVDALSRVPWLIGGHRISPHLPWYRGAAHRPMETEAQSLCQTMQEQLFGRPLAIAIDCHSGFGLLDRIWFPFASQHAPAPHLAEAFALRKLFNDTYPQHSFYRMEPQSVIYCTHGDLWDYLYQQHLQQHLQPQQATFLPFTLEMGSWTWVQKNPSQLFSLFGHFNPVLPHRLERVLRRHLTLLNFLLQAAAAGPAWLPDGPMRTRYTLAALERWYPDHRGF